MPFQQFAQPVISTMHTHLERRDRRAGHRGDLLVRHPVHMFQHEHLALLHRQLLERLLERPAALALLYPAVGAVRRRHGVILSIERTAFARPPAPLSEAAVAQNQEQPSRKLVGFPTLRQLIERPDERVLDRVLGRIDRAEHPGGVAGKAVAVAAHQHRDRKSTRLNSSHGYISYAVFCLKKKKCWPHSTPAQAASRWIISLVPSPQ